MTITKSRGIVWLGLLLASGGCAKTTTTPGLTGQNDGQTLNIAAASDLRTVLPKIVAAYEGSQPGHKPKVIVTFGASGQLAEGIKAGAPFDVYLAANEAFVRDLAVDDAYVLRDTVRRYAVGTLVLAVHTPTRAETAVTGLDDLLKPEVKAITIAHPRTAPYGAAAKQALTRAGLWEKLESKIVYAENVLQTSQFVQTGNADAGFVSHASTVVDTRVNLEAGAENGPSTHGDLTVIAIDAKLYDPIIQSLGVVSRSTKRAAAEEFVHYLTGAEGRAAFAKYGFKLPPGDGDP